MIQIELKMKIETEEITRSVRHLLGAVVAKTAGDVEATAKSLAPVDTGFLRNSIQAERVTDLEWEVNVGAEYGAYVELGTSRMAPRPYLTPAVEAVREPFRKTLAAVVEHAGD